MLRFGPGNDQFFPPQQKRRPTATDFAAHCADQDAEQVEIVVVANCKLGPFEVTVETAQLFGEAVELAKRDLAVDASTADDRAIAAIARKYLDASEAVDTPVLPGTVDGNVISATVM